MGPDYVAGRVQALDRDDIHRLGVMNPGVTIGLGHHGQSRRLGIFVQHGGRRHITVGIHRGPVLAQQPQAGIGQIDHGLAVVVSLDGAAAIAEKREVVIGQPRQKGLGFLALFAVDAAGGLIQIVNDLLQAPTHGAPVANYRVDIDQAGADLLAKRCAIQAGRCSKLDANQRLGRSRAIFAVVIVGGHVGKLSATVTTRLDHGVDDPVDLGTGGPDGHGDGVHQERHILGHADQRRVAAAGSVVDVNDLGQRRAGRAWLCQQRIVRLDRIVETLGPACRDQRGGNPVEIDLGKRCHGRPVGNLLIGIDESTYFCKHAGRPGIHCIVQAHEALLGRYARAGARLKPAQSGGYSCCRPGYPGPLPGKRPAICRPGTRRAGADSHPGARRSARPWRSGARDRHPPGSAWL